MTYLSLLALHGDVSSPSPVVFPIELLRFLILWFRSFHAAGGGRIELVVGEALAWARTRLSRSLRAFLRCFLMPFGELSSMFGDVYRVIRADADYFRAHVVACAVDCSAF